MAPGPGLCEECGTPAHERFETITQRLVCQQCSDDLFSAAGASMMTGGGVGKAVSLHGWIQRVRAWREGRHR